jgi:hypothetical protein
MKSPAGAPAATSCYMDVTAGKYKTAPKGNDTAACATGYTSSAHTSNYGSSDSCSAKTYTVKYCCYWENGSCASAGNSNYGSAPSATTVQYNTSFSTSGYSGYCSLTGWSLTGWQDLTNDTTWTGWSGTWKYDNGQHGISNNVLWLTGVWKKNQYTLTYNNNGGEGCTTKTVNAGQAWGDLCTPTRSNYRFIGWYSYGGFDKNYYADHNPDVVNVFGRDGAYDHYLTFGFGEGRRGSAYHVLAGDVPTSDVTVAALWTEQSSGAHCPYICVSSCPSGYSGRTDGGCSTYNQPHSGDITCCDD